jgi:hypothetical protein
MSNFVKHINLSYDTKQEKLNMSSHGGIDLETALNILLVGIVQITNQLLAAVPESHKQIMRENVHDRLNSAFYNILTELIPDEEVPDLLADTIIETQNQIIAEAAEKGISVVELLEQKKADKESKDEL